jgi:hypothetical protein
VAREGHGAGGGLCDGRAAIVSVLAEAFGDDKGTQDDEGNQGDCDDDREPDEMFNIFEQGCAPDCRRELHAKKRNALGYLGFGRGTMIEVTGDCDGGHHTGWSWRISSEQFQTSEGSFGV